MAEVTNIDDVFTPSNRTDMERTVNEECKNNYCPPRDAGLPVYGFQTRK